MITPMAHQVKAVEICRAHSHYGFWWEPGAGKTIGMLSVCLDRPRDTIVVCSKAIMRAAWEPDAEQMGIDITVLHGTPPQRRKLMQGIEELPRPRIVVTNYETFRTQSMRDWLFKQGFKRLIFDESSKLKNPTSKISKATVEYADLCDEVYLLSGTPAPNGPSEYWPQLRAINNRPGSVADSPRGKATPIFSRWANYFLVPIKANVGGRMVIIKWVKKKQRSEDFDANLKSCSWYLTKDECADLPEQRDVAVRVTLSDEEDFAYGGILEELRTSFNGSVVSINAQAQLTKLRQVTSGFMYHNEGTEHLGTTKLDACKAIVEDLGSAPVVVWGEYTHELNSIAAMLHTIGRKPWILDGKTKGNVGTLARKFQAFDPECDALVCHPASVAHGVTLTRASHSIFYSYSFSYEQHRQARDRIHRIGQKNACTYYYIQAHDTVDENIYRTLVRKEKDAGAVLQTLQEITQ